MKKEFKAQFTRNETPVRWENATKFATGKLYNTSIEDAKKALEYVKKCFPDNANETINPINDLFSVSAFIDNTTAHKIAVNKTRILVREVTEWKETL
jgi:hypothetical protein